MTPGEIIQRAQADGVELIVFQAGAIKATGDGVVVERWIPAIREHKDLILEHLSQEQAVLTWLASIGETDPAIIAATIAKCRRDPDALAYFLTHAAEVAL